MSTVSASPLGRPSGPRLWLVTITEIKEYVVPALSAKSAGTAAITANTLDGSAAKLICVDRRVTSVRPLKPGEAEVLA